MRKHYTQRDMSNGESMIFYMLECLVYECAQFIILSPTGPLHERVGKDNYIIEHIHILSCLNKLQMLTDRHFASEWYIVYI